MPGADADLDRVIAFLASSDAFLEKAFIRRAYAPALDSAGPVRLGDDCAALPDGSGFLPFAAEGMLPGFVADDPWFAGYSAIMVNISDIASMGGRPLAIVDILWSPDAATAAPVWQGMNAASRAYGVPIVGGHTTRSSSALHLAAAVMGRAGRLVTSFDAVPGDDLLVAVDLRGEWRGARPFWNASTGAPPERLRADLEILPAIAASGLCLAGKDISNGGIAGTLAMLLDCSGVGAELSLDLLPKPAGADLNRWLTAFPSFGFLLSVAPQNSAAVAEKFHARGIACETVGRVTAHRSLVLRLGSARRVLLEASDDAAAAWRLHTTSP